MPEETIAPPKENQVPDQQPKTDVPDNSQGIAVIVSAILAGSFFLPWFNLLGIKMSVYGMQKATPGVEWLWALPGFAALVFVTAIITHRNKVVEGITGAIPFVFMLYFIKQEGTDLLQIMDMGAYLSLLCGLILMVLPIKR